MGTYYNILSSIKISGTLMDKELYDKLCRILSNKLKKYDYSDYDYYAEVDALSTCAHCGGGNDGIDTLKCQNDVKGHVSYFITWLHLIDVYILRPHGCYIDKQPISYADENLYGNYDHGIIIFNNNDEFGIEIIRCNESDDRILTKQNQMSFDDKMIYENFKKIYDKTCTEYDYSCKIIDDDEYPSIKYTVNDDDFYVFDVNDEDNDQDYIIYKYDKDFNWNMYFNKSITKYIDMMHKKIENIC
jgi:hypothetical protein